MESQLLTIMAESVSTNNQTKNNMTFLVKILDILALIIQFSGALIMYMNSPENSITTAREFGDTVYERAVKNKNWWLNKGFLILSIGIFVAILSLVLRDIYLPE